MVSRARQRRGILPRDEHVSRGIEANRESSHEPYAYDLKWKSGTGRSRNKSIIAMNRIDAFGQMIAVHAEEGKDFFVWNVSRALRYQSKVRDY